MNRILIVMLMSFTFSHCTEQANVATAPDGLIIRTGTSFGMCVGYCQNEYIIDRTRVLLTQNGTRTQAQHPTKTCETVTNQEAWTAIRQTANFDRFSKLSETLGCPDCADGGAEFVELQLGEQKHRVTFEFNKTIPGFESLVNTLRAQRTAFVKCP